MMNDSLITQNQVRLKKFEKKPSQEKVLAFPISGRYISESFSNSNRLNFQNFKSKLIPEKAITQSFTKSSSRIKQLTPRNNNSEIDQTLQSKIRKSLLSQTRPEALFLRRSFVNDSIYPDSYDTKLNHNTNLSSLKFSYSSISKKIRQTLETSGINPSKSDNIKQQLTNVNMPFYKIEPSKTSKGKTGIIKAYAANTNIGISRTYNEDRVSIIMNVQKPESKGIDVNWPSISFFAIYDGHGGARTADYLRDNLHSMIFTDKNFPLYPYQAIKRACAVCEQQLLQSAEKVPDRSGSCAIIILIVESIIYVANVGDSRAIISKRGGLEIAALTRDHKPNDDYEKRRIISNGGQVYQTQLSALGPILKTNIKMNAPYRVIPGKLSVSRTFGDIEGKLPKYGGNPRVLIADPEIFIYQHSQEDDFILLCSDGIFDRLSNQDLQKLFWSGSPQKNIHNYLGKVVENIFEEAFQKRTMDNVTCVIIAFKNAKTILKKKQLLKPKQII